MRTAMLNDEVAEANAVGERMTIPGSLLGVVFMALLVAPSLLPDVQRHLIARPTGKDRGQEGNEMNRLIGLLLGVVLGFDARMRARTERGSSPRSTCSGPSP